ncbi:MAG TPA: LUD domain-containing protein [Pseudonocardiaceae bacterium]
MSTQPTPDERFAAPAAADAIERAAEAARGNGVAVEIADSVADARKLVNDLLPKDKAVFTASSETLRLSGLIEDVDESGAFASIRAQLRDEGLDADRDQVRLRSMTADVIVGSLHAVTEQGELLAASASGSQLGPYAYGAGQAVWVVGAQKVVPDLETALRRIRTYSYPKENERCMQVYGQPSVLGKILIIEREVFPARDTLVLVRETIGF